MASNKNIQVLKKQANKAKTEFVHFFNPVDKGSCMPSWYDERLVQEDEEWVERARREIKRGIVPPERIENLRAELVIKERKLEQIAEARKSVKDMVNQDKDKYAKRFKELESFIADSMPTRDEMNHKPKLIDPKLEAARMEHRDPLVNLYKVIGRVLGEEVNVEALRR